MPAQPPDKTFRGNTDSVQLQAGSQTHTVMQIQRYRTELKFAPPPAKSAPSNLTPLDRWWQKKQMVYNSQFEWAVLTFLLFLAGMHIDSNDVWTAVIAA